MADQTVIRVGVTGHRFLAERAKLAASIDAALHAIDAAFGDPDWTVISALAEGADRLVVERVLLCHPAARLVTPLPLPVADYLQDWPDAERQEAFLRWLGRADEIVPPAPFASREEGYLAAGQYVLDHCDVLIALWDGQLAQGRGGSGEIVAAARSRGLPVAWVRTGNRRPGTEEPLTLGAEQGRLTLERFPG